MKIMVIVMTLLVMVTLCTCCYAEPVKVILDCDMGYMNDDALCLSMLLKAEEQGLVKVLGITLEGGNNFINASYENYGATQFGSAKYTEDLLASLQRTDIPVYVGTDFPTGFDKSNIGQLAAFYEGLEYLKFDDNYGAIHFFDNVDQELLCDSNEAAEFLVNTVLENPDEVVLFAIGPTMNIARAVRQNANFAPHVKAIYYMGGALGKECTMENCDGEMVNGIDGANVTSVTEYNVLYDPCSFYECITAPFPKQYIFPGSCNVGIDETIAAQFIASSTKEGICALWAKHYTNGIPEYPYWDPLTAYAFLKPEAIAESSEEYVTVNTDRSSDSFGQTDGFTDEEYAQLSLEEQSRCGKAQVIYQMSGFWEYVTELFCK